MFSPRHDRSTHRGDRHGNLAAVQGQANLSINDWAVLGVIVDHPRHGYDIAAALSPGTPIGDTWRLSRQLVYRSLERLETYGLAESRRTEPGDAAPPRTIVGATRQGRRELATWLDTPVWHVRDARAQLLLKLVLAQQLGHDRSTLVRAQREAFADLFANLDERPPATDVVALWRHHSVRAVRAFLDEL